MTEVPACVRKLRCLQYLDVSGCTAILCLPDWIGDVTSLSHLDIRDCSSDLHDHMPKGISNLSRLRILRSGYIPLSTEENKFLNVKDVSNLINLQEMNFSLDVGGLRSVEDGILDGLVKMRIRTVWNDIPAGEDDILPAYPEKMNAMKDLQELTLGCFSMPNWICGMVNLRALVLHQCSDYSCLRNIPNLQELYIHNDQRCRELPKKFGESGGFPKLVRLGIGGFTRLEQLPALEEGAMQRLVVLEIRNCQRVKKVPEGLEHLRRLKEIWVYEEVNGELDERLKEGGEDWIKIKAANSHLQILME